MISVEEIMTTRLYTLTADHSVYDARQLMHDKDIRHIPIVNEPGQLVGLITQRDLLRASESSLHVTSDEARIALEQQHRISEVMTTHIHTIHPGESLKAAALQLRKFKHGCLPVVANGQLLGIITDTDFVGVAVHLIEQMESQNTADGDFGDDSLYDDEALPAMV